jgi:hypothetical protein
VLVSGITVVALVIGSLAAVRALSEGTDRTPTPAEDPWAGYEVFERTAKVGNFTITSPSDWYLVNQFPWARTLWPQLQKQRERDLEACADEPTPEERRSCRSGLSGVPGDAYVVPLLMLSDTDRGLESSPCFDRSFSVAPDEAVMTVALDRVYFSAYFGAGDRAQWPVPFDTPSADDRLSCGPGTYVYFAANDIPYVAHFAFGESVSAEERQTLIASFEGMRVEGGQEFLVEEPQPDDRAAYVIAGGENAAGPWTLELRRSTGDGPSANVELSVTSPEGEGVSADDFSVPDEAPIEQAGGDPTFGAVTKEASGVELRLEEGTPPVPAQVMPLPPSMPFDFDLFFASYDGDVPAQAVPVRLESTGQSETTGSPDAAPEASAEGDLVTLSGADHDLGVRWTMKLSGSVEEPCIDLDTRIDFDPWCPSSLSSPQPILSIWADQGRFLLAGSAPARFDDVRFVGESWQSEGKCVEGPTGWEGRRGCVLPLLGLEDGTIIFSGDQGELSWTLDREARVLPEKRVPGATRATGEFLGFPWSVETGFYQDGIDVNVDGAERSIERPNLDEAVVLAFPRSEFQALLMILTDLSVDQVSVASEGRWYGRWMHSATRDGDEARLWIVELPGAGSGALSYDGKPVASVSWP